MDPTGIFFATALICNSFAYTCNYAEIDLVAGQKSYQSLSTCIDMKPVIKSHEFYTKIAKNIQDADVEYAKKHETEVVTNWFVHVVCTPSNDPKIVMRWVNHTLKKKRGPKI